MNLQDNNQISDEELRPKDIAWQKISNELKRILSASPNDRNIDEKRCVRSISLRLLRKLEAGEQAWQEITPDVWVYLEKRIKDVGKWKPLNL